MGKVVPNWENGESGLDGSVLEVKGHFFVVVRSFVHYFIRYLLLSACYVPGTGVFLRKLIFQWLIDTAGKKL